MRTIFFGEKGSGTYSWFESVFKLLVHKDNWVLDIGSNIGAATAPLSDLVGQNGKVICFEPNHFFVEEAKQNLINRHNITYHTYACGYEYGFMDYYFAFDNGQVVDHKRNIHVDEIPFHIKYEKTKLSVKSIDTYDFIYKNYVVDIDKIKFIKIDAEGYDAHILNNLKPLLDKIKPLIQIEWFINNKSIDDKFLVDTIEKVNYDAFIIVNNTLSNLNINDSMWNSFHGKDLILKPKCI